MWSISIKIVSCCKRYGGTEVKDICEDSECEAQSKRLN